MSSFENESRAWDSEVDHEAAELVRRGTPPYEAIQRARDAVSRRRRDAGRQQPWPLDVTCPWPSQKPGHSR